MSDLSEKVSTLRVQHAELTGEVRGFIRLTESESDQANKERTVLFDRTTEDRGRIVELEKWREGIKQAGSGVSSVWGRLLAVATIMIALLALLGQGCQFLMGA